MRFDLQLSNMHIVIVEQFSSKSSIFSNIYVQNILVTIYFKLLFWQNPYKWTRNPKFYIYYIYTGNIHLIFFINYHDVRYIWGYNLNARTTHTCHWILLTLKIILLDILWYGFKTVHTLPILSTVMILCLFLIPLSTLTFSANLTANLIAKNFPSLCTNHRTMSYY